MDELGSGVRNIYKYNKIYSGVEPTFIEGDIFKTIIPLTTQVTVQATTQADEEVKGLLGFCAIPRGRSEMQEFMKLSNREHFRKNILNPLIKGGVIEINNAR